MSGFVIRTSGLCKTYRSRRGEHVAVDNLDLNVPAGGVHGFLGPNGSGKTTTIRMLLGLSRATGGSMEVLGEQVPAGLPTVMPRIGAVVESPKFFPGFSGRKNLTLLADVVGVPHRVDEVLERVDLLDRAKDRYGGYSLGMRQRLAIAATLLKQPDLLILDEPTNGLDPQGIRDIRDMIRSLGSSGVTVLLSSHILAEVEQVCDSVSILDHGRLVTSGRVSDLVGAQATSEVRVRVAESQRAKLLLEAGGLVVEQDEAYLVVQGVPDPSVVTRVLAGHGLYVAELTPRRVDLETAFLHLTNDPSDTTDDERGAA